MLEETILGADGVNSDFSTSLVDLGRLSKRELVEKIVAEKPKYKALTSLTATDLERAQECPIRLVGFDQCPYLNDKDLQALLVKLLPRHLLSDFQHTKVIEYVNTAIAPHLTQAGQIEDVELTAEAAQGNPLRTIAKKIHGEPVIRVYSPVGMHEDKDVLRAVMLQGIVHDLGHGIFDYYFDMIQNGDEAQGEAALGWMNNLLDIVMTSSRSMSGKSQAYANVETDFFLEELAEMVRMYVFEREEFARSNFGTNAKPNHDKYNYTKAMFERGKFNGDPALLQIPTVIQ